MAARVASMLSLVLAGEAIFFLPFHITRHFRPTFVEVFGIGQDQLGGMQALYGIVAAVAYLAGGGVADSIQPRKLLAGSLVVTGLSGLYLASIPSAAGLYCLHAFWGASTIVPFWSALIRATRDWGSDREQGAAFGWLDGGRGLMAALLGLCAFLLFAWCFPGGIDTATPQQRVDGLRQVIITYTLACFFAAASAYVLIAPARPDDEQPTAAGFDWSKLRECFAMPAVWLQAGIIVAAYTIYKGRDFYTQYAHDVWGWSEIETANFSTLSTWVRPVAAVGAGLLADRWRTTRVIGVCFALAAAAFGSLLVTTPGSWLPETLGPARLLGANILLSCVAMFALRGVYFAVMEEADVPRRLTGAAVGVISFVGFTPEIFVPLVGGMLIQGEDGGGGFTTLWWLMLLASLGGLAAAVVLERRLTRGAR